jgi:hypothetical protein
MEKPFGDGQDVWQSYVDDLFMKPRHAYIFSARRSANKTAPTRYFSEVPNNFKIGKLAIADDSECADHQLQFVASLRSYQAI